MAVRSKEDLITSINAIIGETPDDAGLALLEDVSDTLASYVDTEDWKSRYEENDAEWRKRYRDRFENGDESTPPPKQEETKLTFEDLFE